MNVDFLLKVSKIWNFGICKQCKPDQKLVHKITISNTDAQKCKWCTYVDFYFNVYLREWLVPNILRMEFFGTEKYNAGYMPPNKKS